MNVGQNIKRLREGRGIKQNEIADLIGMHRSNYSKIESGQREISIAAIDKIAGYFNISIDELVHMGNDLPKEVSIEDKTVVEQVKLIQELDQEEKNMVFKMVETFLTKKKFKDFFNKNIAAL
jgi:transcriptional regulator with XRE-family HTH domain